MQLAQNRAQISTSLCVPAYAPTAWPYQPLFELAPASARENLPVLVPNLSVPRLSRPALALPLLPQSAQVFPPALPPSSLRRSSRTELLPTPFHKLVSDAV